MTEIAKVIPHYMHALAAIPQGAKQLLAQLTKVLYVEAIEH